MLNDYLHSLLQALQAINTCNRRTSSLPHCYIRSINMNMTIKSMRESQSFTSEETKERNNRSISLLIIEKGRLKNRTVHKLYCNLVFLNREFSFQFFSFKNHELLRLLRTGSKRHYWIHNYCRALHSGERRRSFCLLFYCLMANGVRD